MAYSQTITASGGTGPYTYTVSAGSLPTGLTLAPGGGLTGTPTVAATYNFTVLATDALAFTGSRAYAVTISASSSDLSVSKVYITQSTQSLEFDVPLVKDRNGYLRAFVIANQANSLTPSVRVRIYNGGSLLQTYTITAPGSSVPTSINESSLTSSWNQLIPGSLLQPGYSLLVDVDPDNSVPETNESNNAWPVSGTAQVLDVRNLPVFNVTMVPVQTGAGTGNVTAGNAGSFLDYTRRMHPMPDYNAQVHATMVSSATLQSNGTGWDTALNEVTALRTADGSSRYYYGAVHVTYSSGVAGLGWIGYPAAIGWDYLPSGSWVMAHELGHNWNRHHVSCSGGESGTDPAYPYAGGAIGVYGYDLWSSVQKDKTTYKDIMSYCGNQWVSDYTYENILSYRASSGYGFQGPGSMAFTGDHGAPKETCLLVWGLRRDGQFLLEPSFQVTTRPATPEPGPCRVEGLSANGATLWSQSFELMLPTHLPDPTAAGFCFAVPVSATLIAETQTIRILESGVEVARRTATKPALLPSFAHAAASASIVRSGNEIQLAWDEEAAPVVLVRDVDGQRCLGFARDGFLRIPTDAARLELLFSDGVHTTQRTWSGE